MKIINIPILAVASAMVINTLLISSAVTQEIDRNSFCNKFPLNSRCEDYQSTKSESKQYRLDRNSFCM